MVKAMRDSSLHITLNGVARELNESKSNIEKIFAELFEESAVLVSDARGDLEAEIIYEIKTPVVNDDEMTKEFFSSLEVLLDELKEFNPHFTQFRRVDVNEKRK